VNRSSGFTGYNPYLSFGRSLYALLPEGDQVSVEQAAFLSGLKTQSTTSAGDSEGVRNKIICAFPRFRNSIVGQKRRARYLTHPLNPLVTYGRWFSINQLPGSVRSHKVASLGFPGL